MLPPSAATLGVVMREYAFDHPPVVGAGRVVFKVRNAGALHHELVLVRLPPDFAGTIDQHVRSDTRVAVATVAVLADRSPGQQGIFAADLTPGRYGFICYLEDPDGRQHVFKGMSSELSVV
ncbi:MAG: hypothetical protein ABR511_01500 [Acidimicrobiales bacterium]